MIGVNRLRARTWLPWLSLVTGVIWLWVGLRNLDLPGILGIYQLRDYRMFQHRGGDVLLPCVTGFVYLLLAALGFIKLRRQQGEGHEAQPVVTTILG